MAKETVVVSRSKSFFQMSPLGTSEAEGSEFKVYCYKIYIFGSIKLL